MARTFLSSLSVRALFYYYYFLLFYSLFFTFCWCVCVHYYNNTNNNNKKAVTVVIVVSCSLVLFAPLSLSRIKLNSLPLFLEMCHFSFVSSLCIYIIYVYAFVFSCRFLHVSSDFRIHFVCTTNILYFFFLLFLFSFFFFLIVICCG